MKNVAKTGKFPRVRSREEQLVISIMRELRLPVFTINGRQPQRSVYNNRPAGRLSGRCRRTTGAVGR